MAKYDLAGVHVLNKFIWDRMKAAGIMSEDEYPGLTPIIPTQQVPAFNDMSAGKPFLVYTYLVSTYDVDTWSNIEQVTYRIFSDDERRLRQVTNFLVDLCKRLDWTAAELNSWIDSFNSTDGDEKNFDFKFVQVMGATSPEPATSEGGRQDSSVTVRMAYTHEEQGTLGNGVGMRT